MTNRLEVGGVIAAVQAFVQDEAEVPVRMRGCPQWLYAAMPPSLRTKLNRISEGRARDESFLDHARSLVEAVPDLAAVAHPPRATHEVSTVWAASPPLCIMGTVAGTTFKIAKWTGVICAPANAREDTDAVTVKQGKRPAHSAAARLDSLDLCVVLDKHERQGDAPMCAICQIEFEDKDIGYVFKGCNHPFHVKCMNHWLEKGDSCPCCRKKLEAHNHVGLEADVEVEHAANSPRSGEAEFYGLFGAPAEEQPGADHLNASPSIDAQMEAGIDWRAGIDSLLEPNALEEPEIDPDSALTTLPKPAENREVHGLESLEGPLAVGIAHEPLHAAEAATREAVSAIGSF